MLKLKYILFGIMAVLFLFVMNACDLEDLGIPTPPTDTPITIDPTPSTSECDRACLMDTVDDYLEALVANDPSSLNVSSSVKYTDNGVAATLGQGLWRTATGMQADKRLDFADPVLKNVASQLVINENSTPVMYQVRLKVVGGEITEIESMTVRRRGAANGFFNVNGMKPEPVFTQSVPASGRMSRDELIRVLDLYVDYLEGDRNPNTVPFDNGCKRYENGVVTASGLSAFRMQSFWNFDVTRRYLVVDEEAQIIWGMLPFSQSNRALVVGEAFKIIGGKIMMIQAVMANMPSKAWD